MGFWWWGYAKMMEIVQEAIELPLKYKKVTGTDDISMNSTDWADIEDMSLTVTVGANPVLVTTCLPIMFGGITVSQVQIRLLIDDVQVEIVEMQPLSGYPYYDNNYTFVWLEVLTAGEHTIKIQWRRQGASQWIYQYGTSYPRQLIVIELVDAEELS